MLPGAYAACLRKPNDSSLVIDILNLLRVVMRAFLRCLLCMDDNARTWLDC